MSTSWGLPFTTRPEIKGTFGVAASTHWLATAVAMRTLERGGNAFDAAVACAFTLQVVEPHLNGPGGEVPLILWSAGERRSRVLCGQGAAPAGATVEAFRRLDLPLVPGTGLLPATVPGVFDAWMQLLRDYGTLPIREVLEPAIYYAQTGHPLHPRICQAIGAVENLFREHWPSSAAIYLPTPKPGSLFRNPALANTFSKVLALAESQSGREKQIELARDAWYRGFVADEVDRFYRQEIMDCTGRRHRGFLNGDDMGRWTATYEEPLAHDYRNYTVLKCGTWSQGIVLLQQLALAEHLDLRSLDPKGETFVHRVAEAAKLCFADRDAWIGDPAFGDVPVKDLLSRDYAAQRARLVGEQASREHRYGKPGGRTPTIPAFGEISEKLARTANASLGIGEPTFAKLEDLVVGDTCHLDVIDRWGNMVSATPSGGWLSSSPAIPALGFCINTRLQISWVDESLPGGLAPGKRPSTTLSPSMALRDGEPYLSFGTPGGDQQDQWQLIFFLRHVDHGMNLQQAIDAPSWHINHFIQSFWPRTVDTNKITLEKRFSEKTLESLKKRGHTVFVGEDWSEGRLSAATKDKDVLKAAANPRGMQGYAAGR